MKKTARISGIVVIVLLALWFIIRSCTGAVLEDDKVYRIARDPTWGPLDLMGKQRNMLGFSNDVLNAIARDVHMRFVLYAVRSSELFDGLDRGDYNAIITSIEPNPMLFTKYEMSNSFYLTGPVVVVPVDSEITAFTDLAGKSVGIRSGSPLVFRIRDFPTILFRTFKNMRVALDQLVEDRLDAVIMDALPAYASSASFYQSKLKIVGGPLNDDGVRLIARKDPRSTAFISQFNKGLDDIVNDGTYRELAEKWDLFDTLELDNKVVTPDS